MKWLMVVLIGVIIIGIAGFSSIFSFQTEQHEQSGKGETIAVEEQEKKEGEDDEPEGADETSTIKLNGEWTRNLLNYTGSLIITNATENDFTFTLGVVAGGNVGSIEGKADRSLETATWLDAESGCELSFELTENKITIEQNNACEYWGGAGTFFNGEYDKGGVSIQTVLVKQGVLIESEDALFRSIVGDDYDLYLENISSYFDLEDRDNLGTRVVAGFIRGIAPSNGGIIMVNEKHVYAAVTDSENNVILYHTNDPTYQDKLPYTITEWREGIMFEEVVFE
ncbi:hypothetical protein [Guptibacillus hwajinpoensis]|uniref:DUF4652 domain-containing protein n=1 Tax=Guptibacillus hwajinpoensis TaxID=208199 RepID=A0ABU0K3I3_9BACL|nr:hypothetical protein [Alkalihalobacillus hemicentroti]MDQ0483919.1 hypothetical protein [Alkalihalobacillus hemicentroti]